MKMQMMLVKINKTGIHKYNVIRRLGTNLKQQVSQQHLVVPCQNHWIFC